MTNCYDEKISRSSDLVSIHEGSITKHIPQKYNLITPFSIYFIWLQCNYTWSKQEVATICNCRFWGWCEQTEESFHYFLKTISFLVLSSHSLLWLELSIVFYTNKTLQFTVYFSYALEWKQFLFSPMPNGNWMLQTVITHFSIREQMASFPP